MNGKIFFELFLSDLDEKITFAGYERHPKGNSETSLSCPKIYLPCPVSHEKRKYSLISALVASNWSHITFFILAKVLTSISEKFWPNFHQINTPPSLQKQPAFFAPARLAFRVLHAKRHSGRERRRTAVSAGYTPPQLVETVQSRGKDGLPRTT